jgi:hypothetical protein
MERVHRGPLNAVRHHGEEKEEVPKGLAKDLLHAVKSYDMRPPALLPIRRKV